MKGRWSTDMICSAGGREYNEDHCNFLIAGEAGCWVLCDGLGGHAGGAAASGLAVETILQRFRTSPEVSGQAIEAHLAAANQAIVERQSEDPALVRMASTAVVLLSDINNAVWAHIGDSRLYHFRRGRAATSTKDHSVAQALADAGDILPSEIRFHPDRASLRRSLGKAEPSQPSIAGVVAIESGDAFLLASDGFWEFVSETEMEVELSKAMTPGDWLRTMERRLLTEAPSGHDNYSAVAVLVNDAR
jgi:serine/threonine protein phosphatase PrpC